MLKVNVSVQTERLFLNTIWNVFEVTLRFTLNEARKMLESAGLTVKIVDMEVNINRYHNNIETEILPTWCVINPNTLNPEPVVTIFRRYLENRRKSLFLDYENKIEIFKLFDKK